MINIAEILKDCPKGTKLYSTICGEVYLHEVNLERHYPIEVIISDTNDIVRFAEDGRFRLFSVNSECLLFPSKDQRDWTKFKKEKFDPRTLKPFDKVLIQYGYIWYGDLFSHYDESKKCYCTCSNFGQIIIPYNDDTKHLIGTKDDCPEYYKWWEE